MNTRIIFSLVISISFFVNKTGAQTKVEDSLSLNGSWSFKTDPSNRGEQDNWFDTETQAGSWDTMDVPSNWDLHNEYAQYKGKAWYKKDVVVPAEWKDKLVRLLFEAVNHDSKVWVNNKLVGSNNSGFLPFAFDISPLIHYGGRNSIVVCADNTFRRGAIWNWGGIRRPVLLVAGNLVRIAGQYVSPSVDLQKGTARLGVRVSVRNHAQTAADVQGEVLLSAKNGFKRSLPFSLRLPPDSASDVILHTALGKAEVHLWNCDDPFLYQSRVTIRDNSGLLHQDDQRFGLRKIEVDNKNYAFRLNGESIRPMGFNLVPDDRTTGNTLPLWRVKEDIDLMKSFGANMARLTHLPLHKEMFDYLDEKGILIYSEIPLWGFDKLADKNSPIPREWLRRLITANYNHPSIIGWGVGNEIGQYPGVMEYVDDAIRYVRELDSTRLGVMVSHTATNARDPIQYSDIGLVNKYGTGIGSLADKMHQLHPGKLLFYAEYGYGQFSEELNADLDAKGMLDSLRFKPYLVGGALWTFNDYRSNFTGTKELSENRAWGIVDVFRQKKKAFYSFRKEYAPVREFKIETGPGASASIMVTPRMKLDLPAYILDHYLVVWKTAGSDGKIIQAGFNKLPLTRPGDGVIKQAIKWQDSEQIASLQVALISPLNYSVCDTTIFFKKPALPGIIYAMGGRTEMNNTPPNSGGIRVVFKKDPSATAYKIRYGREGLTNETPPTVNHYIDIPRLAFEEDLQLALVSMNTAGETQSEITKVQVGYYDLAPPVIYYTEPADKGFFVGYASQGDDYLYKVQYTEKPGDYTNARTIQSTTKGVLFVPGLENGQAYYYRMQRFKHNMYESAWSEEIMVTPDGKQLPAPPVLNGVARNDNEAVLFFNPVKKSTGYLVQYRGKGDDWISLPVNAAQVEHIRIHNLEKRKTYEFRMASINQYGQSVFTGIIQ